MINHWNERYAEKEFAYGILPNAFLKTELAKLQAKKILFVCEGEGRNAVYAAREGWDVSAFDLSEEGKKKALQLANENQVELNYEIGDASKIEFPLASFDAIALIYAHFPVSIRAAIHQKIGTWLKPGGSLILEAFHPDQLQYSSGGPKEISMLYTAELLSEDFKNLRIQYLENVSTHLNEGKYHIGKASVMRLVAITI